MIKPVLSIAANAVASDVGLSSAGSVYWAITRVLLYWIFAGSVRTEFIASDYVWSFRGM